MTTDRHGGDEPQPLRDNASTASGVCPRCGRVVSTWHPKPQCDAWYDETYREYGLTIPTSPGRWVTPNEQANFVIRHAWPGEVLTGLGDVWAKCGCGETINVEVEDGKTITTGDVRAAYRAHLIAAAGGAS